MTRGVKHHTAISEHVRTCAQCRAVDPEKARIRRPIGQRQSVPDEIMQRLCEAGQRIYRRYLAWLAEPE